jgi:hypothetical protein
MTVMTAQDRPNHRLATPNRPAQQWSLRLFVTFTVIVCFFTWLLLFGIASY